MKRILTCFMALLMFVFMLPVKTAQAAVLSGYTSKVDYNNTDSNRYKIEIDLINQVITVYENSSGQIVLQGLCTTGNAENPTGAGTYKLGHLKERFGYFVAFGQYAQYWSQVVRGVYIHSVMHDSKSITDISKSAYNGLGKALSHGCVRVLAAHAQWIFYNCPPGTACVITKSKAKDDALVKKLKAEKPGITTARFVEDFKADPAMQNAVVVVDTPVRTGFSATKDTTVVDLKAGEAITILQLGPDWCKVRTSKGKLGYVVTSRLQIDINSDINPHGRYAANEQMSLYSYPSTSSSTKLLTFEKGEEVEVIGTVDKNWYTARSGSTYGYIRASQVTSLGGQAGNTTDTIVEVTPMPVSGLAYIKNGIIANVRNGPGTTYTAIDELNPGDVVTLLEVTGNWYKVQYNGVTGYVNAVCLVFA